jgi:hypothetical protein
VTPRTGRIIRGTAAVLLFAASALVALLLFAIIVISDLEGATFDPAIRGNASMSGLRCPVFISTSESGTVRAIFDNPLDRPVQYLVRVHVSQGYVTLFRQIDYQVRLDPGQSQTVEWEITEEDAAYGWLVLVKVLQSASYPLPSRSGTCGVPVVPIPFLTGSQLFVLLFGASVVGMVAGIVLWRVAGRASGQVRHDVSNAMIALTTALVVGTLTGLSASWIPGLVLLAGTLLMALAILFYFLFKVE